VLSAESIAQGTVARAIAHYKLTLLKQFQNYQRDQFPAQQKPPAEVRKAYLQDSPGIQTTPKQVRTLAAELTEGVSHPWDKARRFAEWVPKEYPAADRQLHERHRRARGATWATAKRCRPFCGVVPLDRHSGPAGLGAQSQLVRVLSDRQRRPGALDSGSHGLLFLVRMDRRPTSW